ncbi:MAG: ComEC/Rec2 family competence protein [Thermoleophilia bacterium]
MLTRFKLLIFLLAVTLVAGCSSTPSAPVSAPPSAAAVSASTAPPSAKPTTTPKPSHKAQKPKPKAPQTAKPTSSSAPVTIAFVNVGQGDGIVIKDGSWAGMIDGGKAGEEGAIAAELSSLGVSRLNMMLATHPDADHIGDLAALAQEFQPKVAYSDDVGTTQTYGRFIAALHAVHSRIVSVFRGQTLRLGALSAKVLNPASDGSDTNADSIVLLLDIDGHRVLLTGDDYGATESYVADICARGPPLYILKVAHHGSAYATSAYFLSETRPHYAVISVGPNSYGHPASSTVGRLKAAHATTYTTQTNGTVTVTFYASGAVHWSFGDSSKPFVMTKATSAPVAPAQTAKGSTIVYVTATGSCYHRRGCRYLSKSCIRITLAKAKAEGYRPCSVCDPPQ